MTKYIDADAQVEELAREINKTGKYTQYECGLDDAIYHLNNAPAADVVEVVRCKDCVNFLEMVDSYGVLQCSCMRSIKGEDYSENGALYPLEAPVKEHDFCSYGKKMDKEEE